MTPTERLKAKKDLQEREHEKRNISLKDIPQYLYDKIQQKADKTNNGNKRGYIVDLIIKDLLK